MEFVLDSFSVKADDSSYFTKDGHGGKEFDCAVPVSFRERSCSSRAQWFPAFCCEGPLRTRIDGFARLHLQLSGKESHRRRSPVQRRYSRVQHHSVSELLLWCYYGRINCRPLCAAEILPDRLIRLLADSFAISRSRGRAHKSKGIVANSSTTATASPNFVKSTLFR
jgi:hypothetical protein